MLPWSPAIGNPAKHWPAVSATLGHPRPLKHCQSHRQRDADRHGGRPDEQQVAFDAEAIAKADTVFDVVALPAETPLIAATRAAGKTVITGAEVIALQAAEQFARYTGVRPSREQVEAAAGVSRV